jgi:hypothetical protein
MEIKSIIIVVMEFFKDYNQKIDNFQLGLTIKGQVEYANGTLYPGAFDSKSIEKSFRKKLVAQDYRFCNCSLEFKGSEFKITSK